MLKLFQVEYQNLDRYYLLGQSLKKIQSHNCCPSLFFCGTNELLVIARSLLLFKYLIFPFYIEVNNSVSLTHVSSGITIF